MIETRKGKYIVIEGTDGAGKTTQKKLLRNILMSPDQPVVDLIEPGGTDLGLALRSVILDPDIEKLPETEFGLFTIARRELVYQVIDPSIFSGSHVVCDRNWFSSVAYQGFGRGMDIPAIIEQTKQAMGDYFMPDSITILDVPVEITEERLRTRRSKEDWFEQQQRDFFAKVREGYMWLAEEFEVDLVNGTPSVEVVHQDLLSHLGNLALI